MYTLFPNANIPKRAWLTATTENITKNGPREVNDLRIVKKNMITCGLKEKPFRRRKVAITDVIQIMMFSASNIITYKQIRLGES